MAYAASGCRLALALALRLADTRSRSAQFIALQCIATQRTALCATCAASECVEDRNACSAAETMAARRPLGTLTNTQQQAAAPPKPAPKPAIYRCDHCFSFTGSYAAVAAHEATCPCAAPSIKREVVPPPPAAPSPKRRIPLWVLVCVLWAGYEAARPIPQPVCPARPRPFDEILIEQLADVAASESTALVVREDVGYGVAGKLGNAFLKALFAPVRVLLAPFRMMFRRR